MRKKDYIQLLLNQIMSLTDHHAGSYVLGSERIVTSVSAYEVHNGCSRANAKISIINSKPWQIMFKNSGRFVITSNK